MKYLILALMLAVSTATADDLLLGVRTSTGAKQKTLAIGANRVLVFDGSGEPVFLTYPAFLEAIGAVSVSRQISTGGGLAGGGNLSADRTLTLTGQALAFHNLASSGMVVRTGADAVTARALVASGEGITVANGNGVNGNPAISLSDDVAALEALLSTGFAVRTGSNTWSLRSLSVSGNGISISNGNGVSANPTFSLADDVAALEALASTGFAVRTGSNSWAQRSIAVAAGGKITVTNGDGVSGNPTLDVADSTTSQKGALAIATNGEVQTGTDSLKAVVSSSLGAWWTWVKTQAQTIAGNWNFTGNVTAGDAAGDSFTVNAGTVTAPNATAVGPTNIANVGGLDGRYGKDFFAIYQGTNLSITSNTTLADTALVSPTLAPGNYIIEIALYGESLTSTTPGWKYRLNFTGAAGGRVVGLGPTSANGGSPNFTGLTINTTAVITGAASNFFYFTARGTLGVSTSGVFSVQIAQNASSTDPIVFNSISVMSIKKL